MKMKCLLKRILIINVMMLVVVPIIPIVSSDGIFPYSTNPKKYKVTLTGHDMGGTCGKSSNGEGYNFGPFYYFSDPWEVFYHIEDKTKPVLIVNGTHYEYLLTAPYQITVYLRGFRGIGPTLLMYIIFGQFDFTRIRVQGYCNEIRIEQHI
jgi:hypothetical protein